MGFNEGVWLVGYISTSTNHHVFFVGTAQCLELCLIFLSTLTTSLKHQKNIRTEDFRISIVEAFRFPPGPGCLHVFADYLTWGNSNSLNSFRTLPGVIDGPTVSYITYIYI